MRIGLITPLHGRPDEPGSPTWNSIRARAIAAEKAGFDSFVFEDALLYRGESGTDGCWESFSVAAALAEATEEITIAQSVVNAPYRSPALTAKIAETIDEISGGRFVLGIGAGNTPDSDYEAFGFPVDKRYSRFAEAIEIIHSLLKEGKADFRGRYWTAKQSELVVRGPRPEGPPINIAAGGPKMLELAARFGDAWNWWGYDETLEQVSERLIPIIEALDAACVEIGRDPSDLGRTIDLYTVVPPGMSPDGAGLANPVAGSPGELAEYFAGLAHLGFSEVRCDLHPKSIEGVEAMQPVVDLVHAI